MTDSNNEKNPLEDLGIEVIGPCNCAEGALVAKRRSGEFICIPKRPHFKSNLKVRKPKVLVGLGDDLRARVARISEHDSNLSVLAKAILHLDDTARVK